MKNLKQALISGCYLWIVLLLGMAGLTLLLQIKHTKQRARLLTRIEDLRTSLNTGKGPPGKGPGLSDKDLEELQKKGLKDPRREIVADLQKHPELIPYKGVLGGRMGFYSPSMIQILSKQWVFAYFEDGHRGGWLLLEFRVTPGGQISWKVLRSYLD